MKETSAKELWTNLEEKYMTKSAKNQLFLKKQLFHFQYLPGISMHKHLNDYNKILANLANLHVKIPDEDKALPDNYDHLTTTLLYEKSDVELDKVSAALVNHQCYECAFCRQKGHWKKDCPKLKNKEKDKAGSEANVAKSGDDDFEFVLASPSANGHSKKWILDSGCTYHICLIREWFSGFQELDGGVVLCNDPVLNKFLIINLFR
ncbi:hypothetical protein L3X38_017996 [Prunus dulcis]|uniref:CCHC-type domain-containing protein n=1 Tax=Prunus dulcis TaxID=3755 RepID=A0AAD4ZAP5_PRUDU|nr:hypothetical protein L3X38_017996 [Prunus dulcis]